MSSIQACQEKSKKSKLSHPA